MSAGAATDPPMATRVDLQAGLAILTLCGPDGSNAIDHRMAAELREAINAIRSDSSVRAVLIRSEGRAFCVGGDLKSFARAGLNAPGYVRGVVDDLHAALVGLAGAPAPVVAAVRGAAAGAGLGVALAADIVIASDDAKFATAYLAAGVTPDAGTSWILPQLVGLRRSLDLMLRPRVLSAKEALALGLISETCADEDLDVRATSVASELAVGPTAAYVATRRLLRQAVQTGFAEHLAEEAESVVNSFAGPDGQEGARAFLEKRVPHFVGQEPISQAADGRSR